MEREDVGGGEICEDMKEEGDGEVERRKKCECVEEDVLGKRMIITCIYVLVRVSVRGLVLVFMGGKELRK